MYRVTIAKNNFRMIHERAIQEMNSNVQCKTIWTIHRIKGAFT